MSKQKYYWSDSSGQIEIELPLDCIMDCSQSGANDEAVNYWCSKELDLDIPTRMMVNALAETGGWTREALSELDDQELTEKIVWIACHDLRDQLVEDEDAEDS